MEVTDYDQAIKLVRKKRRASVLDFQRGLGLGYCHAQKLMDRLENDGIVGPAVKGKPRLVNWDKL